MAEEGRVIWKTALELALKSVHKTSGQGGWVGAAPEDGRSVDKGVQI